MAVNTVTILGVDQCLVDLCGDLHRAATSRILGSAIFDSIYDMTARPTYNLMDPIVESVCNSLNNEQNE